MLEYASPNYCFRLTKYGCIYNVAAQLWLCLKAALEVNIEILVYMVLHKVTLKKKARQFVNTLLSGIGGCSLLFFIVVL
jgi:hypothetical protein